MHYPTDRIAHTTAFVTPVVEHWLFKKKVYLLLVVFVVIISLRTVVSGNMSVHNKVQMFINYMHE